MAIAPLLARRTKPTPKHALDHRGDRRRRGPERHTLLLLCLLILSSGFVVGTTATFNAATKNSNSFSTVALREPSNPAGGATGAHILVKWDKPSINAGTGYLVSWKDSDSTNPIDTDGSTTSCASGGTFTKVASVAHNSGITTHSWTDTSATTRTNFADGRIYCYQIQSAYPYQTSPATTIPNTAWLSQVDNPIGTYVAGNTLINVTSGCSGTAVCNNNVFDVGTYFTFTFNQPIATANAPTGTICLNGNAVTGGSAVAASIFIGMSGTTKDDCKPDTETMTGFQIAMASNPTTAQKKRFNMTITWDASCGVSPTSCDIMTATASSVITGSNATYPVLASTVAMTARGATNSGGTATYMQSVGTTVRKFCQGGTATRVVAGKNTAWYRADPTNGRCIISATNNV